MVLAFLIIALLVIGPARWTRSISDTPLIFFAAVMLTEPLTTPPTRLLRIIYGVIIGLLFAPQIHFGSIYTTPEIALIIGNIFSYIVSPKYKLVLRLKEKIQVSPDVTDFVFASDKRMNFKPGQYMEWTLSHPKPDDRGNRRYLTLASSPTESEIRVGVKIGNPPSSYKKSLSSLNVGDTIVASQLTGDFTMPKNWSKKLVFTPNKKSERLVFIAGGIGVTPFRSMIKYLIDRNEKRDIVVLYSVKDEKDFVYKDIFDEAEKNLGIKTHYSVGRFTPEFVVKEIGDYEKRTYFLSGPKALVDGFKSTLKSLGVGKSQIKTDYFPGFA